GGGHEGGAGGGVAAPPGGRVDAGGGGLPGRGERARGRAPRPAVPPQDVALATREEPVCQEARLARREAIERVGGVGPRQAGRPVAPGEKPARHPVDLGTGGGEPQDQGVVPRPTPAAVPEAPP